MKPTVDAYTIAMPWYDRGNFSSLWKMAHDRPEVPSDYQEWHRKAVRVMKACVVRGRTVKIITIRATEFLGWLESHSLPNTAETRLRYVENVASRCRDAA